MQNKFSFNECYSSKLTSLTFQGVYAVTKAFPISCTNLHNRPTLSQRVYFGNETQNIYRGAGSDGTLREHKALMVLAHCPSLCRLRMDFGGVGKSHERRVDGKSAGTALAGFVKGALAKTTGANPDVQSWYALFLKSTILTHPAVWSYVVSYGELLVGIALIIGAFTGIAAFFGLFMNLNYLLAGTVSINPILFTLAIGLILAWRVAGYLGVDYWLLPWCGTPWQPGDLFEHGKK